MQFPESWLREFCNPPLTTQQLADALTMAGLEVEALVPVAPPFSGIVVGEIKAAQQHPNADRLQVCKVDVGDGQLLNIVCGAPNARVGIRVPCALVGAQLPTDDPAQPYAIKLGNLRGVQSEGMLCSARELKLSEDHGGLLELESSAALGLNVRELLQLDDTLFTIKLTPNLAHCLSVYGVARELAALTGAPLNTPKFQTAPVGQQRVLSVNIAAPDLCGRFSGRIISQVNPASETPRWMVDRLARCGQRSVTPLVDISNYVMFELGRPSHIFDLDALQGGLQVRWGAAGEQLKLLNGTTVTVDETVGVISDTQNLESLAGIMGGDASAVHDATRNIFVEAAFWWPQAIAGRSRRFNFTTEAGHRFERGVDPGNTVEHIERITQLVLDICGTSETLCGPIDDHQPNMPKPLPVSMRVARASKVIGMPLAQAQCVNALSRLGLPLVEEEGQITVLPPSWRFDIQIEEDLIEEVARMVGFDKLPETPPVAPVVPTAQTESQRSAWDVRHALAGLGYQETINYSFVDERWEHELAGNSAPVKLLNPIASHMNVMRSSLLGSLLQVVKYNIDRKASRVRVFEIGRVFLYDDSVHDAAVFVSGVNQPMRVAGMSYGSTHQLQWSGDIAPADFFDIKGDLEALMSPDLLEFFPAEHPAMHPGRCAKVVLDGKGIGFIGELHPRWRQAWELPIAPIMFELDLAAVRARRLPVFSPVSKHQAVERDIAVVVAESVQHSELMAAIWAAPNQGLLVNAVLFDVYRPKLASDGAPTAGSGGAVAAHEKSLAVRLTLHDANATLAEEQIETVVSAVVAGLIRDVGARQRV